LIEVHPKIRADIKNLDGIWDDDTYLKTKEKLEASKNEMVVKLDRLNTLAPQFSSYVTNSTNLLQNLGDFYTDCDTQTQKKLVGSIFPDKIYFENNNYQTIKINEAVQLLFNLGVGLKENSPDVNSELSSLAPPVGLEPTTL